MGTQVRQEIERRIGEKEEEFASTKKNYIKAIDGMQTALEGESKGKAESLQLSDLTCQNQAIAGAKRKLESEMQTLHGDLDEMASECGLSEEKAKKAMVDAARLADELRQEQEVAQ